jgi:2-hydroxychromene-2-carboxylate isomerase
MPAVTYFLGSNSPWTYLGHQRFMTLAMRFEIDIVARPIDLPRVFRSSGGLPLAERPIQRRAYRLTELARFSRHLNIPLNPEPRHFPVSGDLAAKLLIATERAHGVACAMNLLHRIGRACWWEQENIADGETLERLAADAKLDGRALMCDAGTPEIEALFNSYTDEAVEDKVFGTPTYVFNGEMFWGQDRLSFLEQALQEQVGQP